MGASRALKMLLREHNVYVNVNVKDTKDLHGSVNEYGESLNNLSTM